MLHASKGIFSKRMVRLKYYDLGRLHAARDLRSPRTSSSCICLEKNIEGTHMLPLKC